MKNILQSSETFEADIEAIREYNVTSSYLQQFFIPNSPAYNIGIAVTEAKVEEFYVNDLVPISTLRCGCLLKSWADIPGRDISPQRPISPSNNVTDVTMTQETPAEEKRDETVVSPNCDIYNIVQTSSCSDAKGASNIESSMEVDCQLENRNSSQNLHLHADERCHEGKSFYSIKITREIIT